MLPPTLILLCSVQATVEVGDSVEANLGAECSLRMVEDLPDLSTALSIVRLLCPLDLSVVILRCVVKEDGNDRLVLVTLARPRTQ